MKKLLLIIALAAVGCKKSDNSTTVSKNDYTSAYGVIWHPAAGNQIQGNGYLIIEPDTVIVNCDTVMKFPYKVISNDSIAFNITKLVKDTNAYYTYMQQYTDLIGQKIQGANVLRVFFYNDSLMIYNNTGTVLSPNYYYRQ
jgi:hypothetical protein